MSPDQVALAPTEQHRTDLARIYGPTTWDVYADLDQTLEPRGPDWLLELAGKHLQAGHSVLDAGCRDAAHLIRLVQACSVRGVGIDPVPRHVESARQAVAASGLQDRISIVETVMDDAPALGEVFDLVWCRDVLEQVSDLDGALAGVSQVLRPHGCMIVFTTVATDLLEPREAELLGHHLGNVAANLDEAHLLAAYARAGLVVEQAEVIGTEWREYAEERTRPASTALLRLARLRRQRPAMLERIGPEVYAHVEANLHWEVFQFLGKLRPMVHVLRPNRSDG